MPRNTATELPPDQRYNDPRMMVKDRRDEPVMSAHQDDSAFASRETLAALSSVTVEQGYVSLERVFFDNYCRTTREANLQRLRSSWNSGAVGAIYVSQRPNGYFAVIDGRHRITVALERGITLLPAIILSNLTYEEEAALYNLYNRVSPHSALDRLQGRVEAKEPKALAMSALIAEVGLAWDFPQKNSAGAIHTVATIEHAFDTWGPEVLRDALHLLHDAWGSLRDAYRDDTIGGTVQFLARYGGYSFSVRDQSGKPVKYDRARMLALMRERQLRIFRSEAMQISQMEHLRRSHSFGRAMRAIYNLHLRSGQLPTWPDRLYTEAGIESHAIATRRAARATPAEERSRRSRKSWATRRNAASEAVAEAS